MSGFGGAQSDSAPRRCYFCGRVVPEGVWFARIMRGDVMLCFCRPRCVEQYLEAPEKRACGEPAADVGSTQ